MKWKNAPPKSAPVVNATRKIKILFKLSLKIKYKIAPAKAKNPFMKVIKRIQYKGVILGDYSCKH